MLNPKTMTAEQEKEMRAKAFHLLKKYTSLTFIGYAVDFNREFLMAFARQLDTPRAQQERYEENTSIGIC